MKEHVVGPVSALPPGSRKIVEVSGRSIGVFNINHEFYAIRNRCPHHGGPLCDGPVGGMMMPSKPYEFVYGKDGEVIRCPWHHWEFDIKTGRMLFDPSMRVRSYDVTVERYDLSVKDGMVVLHA